MKKLMAFVLVLCMALALTACGTADKSLTLGTVEDDVYTNDYFGLRCELPANWTFLDKEELAEQNGLAAQALDGANAEGLF